MPFWSAHNQPNSLLIKKAIEGLYKKNIDSKNSRCFEDVPIEDFNGQYDSINILPYDIWRRTDPITEPLSVELIKYAYDNKIQQYVFYAQMQVGEAPNYFSGTALEKIRSEAQKAEKRLEENIGRQKWREEHFLHGKVKEIAFAFKHATEYSSGSTYRYILLENGSVILLFSQALVKIGSFYKFYRQPENLEYNEAKEVST